MKRGNPHGKAKGKKKVETNMKRAQTATTLYPRMARERGPSREAMTAVNVTGTLTK